MINKNFDELNLDKKVFRSIEDMGFEKPSSIQAEAIPAIIDGMDVIAQSQTGTGKTLAFGAPIISNILNKEEVNNNIQALVLTPTRELALQVTEELKRIGKHARLKIVPIFGGQSIEMQLRDLRRGANIVVGTPGRIIDHMNRGSLKLQEVEHLVVDEADEMLNMGFIDEVENIIKETNEERQTVLFSATMPQQVKNLAYKYMKKDLKHISIVKKSLTVDKIDQYYIQCKSNSKVEALCRVLDYDTTDGVIIFCRTKKGVDELVEALQSKGYNVEGMHGDMGQNQRLNSLKKFKESILDILVATDVAARGIDVQNVSHVINYDIPQDLESYVHRIGRTGRAEREGIAYTLINSKEQKIIRQIENFTKSSIKKKEIPTLEDIMDKKCDSLVESLWENLEGKDYKKFLPIVEGLQKEGNLVHISAALMAMLFEKEVSNKYEQDIAEEESYNRLFLTVGKKDNLNIKSLLSFIDNNAGVKSSEIGDIDILDKFCFMDVSENHARKIIEKANNKKLNGRSVRIEFANRGRN